MRTAREHGAAPAIDAFTQIMGSRHVLTTPRATAPYTTGDRFGEIGRAHV